MLRRCRHIRHDAVVVCATALLRHVPRLRRLRLERRIDTPAYHAHTPLIRWCRCTEMMMQSAEPALPARVLLGLACFPQEEQPIKRLRFFQ